MRKAQAFAPFPGSSCAGGIVLPLRRGHDGGLAPALEDQGPTHVAERGGNDGDHGDGEDRADDAVERGAREGGEENPQRVDADRAALDPRHQDITLDLLSDQKEAGDYQRGRYTAPGDDEGDENGGDCAEEGPDHGDNLRQPDPQTEDQGVPADDEEGYGPAYDAHYDAEEELAPEVTDHGPLDDVEELEGVVAHGLGYRAEHGPGDLLPVEEEVDRDYEHEQEVQDGAEGAEDPPDETGGGAERLPG